jgi:hypothetical protein
MKTYKGVTIMKKVLLNIVWCVAAVTLTSTAVQAGAKKGQRVFHLKMRNACGFSGAYFAKQHTREEWKTIREEGKFKEETLRLCPALNLDTIKEKWWKDVYDFSYKYAKDSNLVPKC